MGRGPPRVQYFPKQLASKRVAKARSTAEEGSTVEEEGSTTEEEGSAVEGEGSSEEEGSIMEEQEEPAASSSSDPIYCKRIIKA